MKDFTELIKTLFDVHKLPTKIFLLVGIIGSLIFYAPSELIPIKFSNNSNLKIYIWLVYAFCTGIFIINCITFIANGINRFFIKSSLKKEFKETLDNLDTFELAVIREFYLYSKNTLEFPFDDPTVVGLVNKDVLMYATALGNGSSIFLSGINTTFKLNKYLKSVIDSSPDYFGLKTNDKEERDKILSSRPRWTKNDLSYND
jgi:hypothetical protein